MCARALDVCHDTFKVPKLRWSFRAIFFALFDPCTAPSSPALLLVFTAAAVIRFLWETCTFGGRYMLNVGFTL